MKFIKFIIFNKFNMDILDNIFDKNIKYYIISLINDIYIEIKNFY